MSAWIKMVPEGEATGVLREMYERAQTPHGTVDNVMKVHSLRPHTMHGHIALYKSVLHHADITSPLWLLEVLRRIPVSAITVITASLIISTMPGAC